MQVLNRLKMELSNQEYFTDGQHWGSSVGAKFFRGVDVEQIRASPEAVKNLVSTGKKSLLI